MDLFEQLANADTQRRGQKLEETGDFVVRLDGVSFLESKDELGTIFAAEFTVVEGTDKNPAGVHRSWVQFPTLAQRRRTDPGNIKAFAEAVIGNIGVTAQTFAELEAGKYNGTLLDLSVNEVTTKGGHTFFNHQWLPHAIDVPALDAPLTKKQWLEGEGPGVTHPDNGGYEYHPDFPDWGVRSKS